MLLRSTTITLFDPGRCVGETPTRQPRAVRRLTLSYWQAEILISSYWQAEIKDRTVA
jgi:hypothetical protein